MQIATIATMSITIIAMIAATIATTSISKHNEIGTIQGEKMNNHKSNFQKLLS